MGATRVHDIADAVLAHVVNALGPPCGIGAPARQYVALGEPVADCEQVSVHVTQVRRLANTDTRLPCMIVPEVVLVAQVLRCVPTMQESGDPPSAADLDDSAAQAITDMWITWQHLANLWANEGLYTGQGCQTVRLGPAVPVAPLGGFGGFRIELQCQVPAFLDECLDAS